MEERLLLRSQMNEVFRAIQSMGMDPSYFLWRKQRSNRTPNMYISVLVHSPSNYYFLFDYLNKAEYAEYSPGDYRPKEEQYPGSWNYLFNNVNNWLAYLKRETEEPDLWAALAQEGRVISATLSSTDDNSMFSIEEKESIRKGLQELYLFMQKTHNLSEQQAIFLKDRLDYLEEASHRMGRKDWKVLAVGVLTSIAVGAMFAPDAARELFVITGKILGWIFTQPHVLP